MFIDGMRGHICPHRHPSSCRSRVIEHMINHHESLSEHFGAAAEGGGGRRPAALP
jgi:hypothetical protein